MTKDRLIKFAEANAHQDQRHGVVKSAEQLEEAFSGYARCLALFGEATTAIRPTSAAAAIDVYQKKRGVICIPRFGTSARVRRLRRSRKKVAPASATLFKNRRFKRAA